MLLSLLVVGMVSAGLVQYFGRKTTDIDVTQAITMPNCNEVDLVAAGGMTIVTDQCTATSQTSVEIPVEITTTGTDAGIASLEVQYELHAEGESPREDRIRVTAEQAGLETLDDLNTISWQQNIEEGYISHVDVTLEDKTLVFEYAKVDAPCDNAPYPTGEQDTFGDKGIVDSDAMAWISSGPAGPCGDETFDVGHKSLSDWKTSDGSKEVIALEFEVDSWIDTTTVKISELEVNGQPVDVITVQPEQVLIFDLIIDFADGAEGTYNLVTDIEVQ